MKVRVNKIYLMKNSKMKFDCLLKIKKMMNLKVTNPILSIFRS